MNSRLKTRVKGGTVLAAVDVIFHDVKGATTWGGAAFKLGSFLGPQTASTAAICAGMVGAVYSSCRQYNTYTAATNTTRAISNEIPLTRENVMKAYVQVRQENIDVSSSPVTVLTESLSDQDQEIQYFGTMHNLILDNLLNGKLSNEDPYIYFSEEELALLNSEEFRNKFEVLMSDDEICDDDDSITEALMNLFEHIFTTYPECKEDIEFITNKYIELVKQSNELSEFDKRLVLSALSVSMASTIYWEDYHGLSK